jgi:hypothetical protein
MSAKSSPPQPAATGAAIFDLPPLPPERGGLPAAPFAGQWVEMALDVPQKEIAAAGHKRRFWRGCSRPGR